ncbi:MAG: hypothetical protein IPH95_08305 [Candidatus Promineofilum sp.]|nr:hypothetical protein [Promineifilum sp.]
MGQLAARLGATLIDPTIAYLTADAPAPFARAYAVRTLSRFQLKRLRGYLRERSVGQVTIKRGSPLEPDALRQAACACPANEAVLFLTQVARPPVTSLGGQFRDRVQGRGSALPCAPILQALALSSAAADFQRVAHAPRQPAGIRVRRGVQHLQLHRLDAGP